MRDREIKGGGWRESNRGGRIERESEGERERERERARERNRERESEKGKERERERHSYMKWNISLRVLISRVKRGRTPKVMSLCQGISV